MKYVTFSEAYMFSFDDLVFYDVWSKSLKMKAPDRSKAGQPGIPRFDR
jgi:hypothetical protein